MIVGAESLSSLNILERLAEEGQLSNIMDEEEDIVSKYYSMRYGTFRIVHGTRSKEFLLFFLIL